MVAPKNNKSQKCVHKFKRLNQWEEKTDECGRDIAWLGVWNLTSNTQQYTAMNTSLHFRKP
jgi:hypothetical protein